MCYKMKDRMMLGFEKYEKVCDLIEKTYKRKTKERRKESAGDISIILKGEHCRK